MDVILMLLNPQFQPTDGHVILSDTQQYRLNFPCGSVIFNDVS